MLKNVQFLNDLPQNNIQFPHYSFNYYFIQLNKMSTLFEDPTSRAQRHRKHQLYKNMLDQQIRFKNQYRQSDSSYKFVTSKHQTPINQPNYPSQAIQTKLPPRDGYAKTNFNSPVPRMYTSQEEQTQKYLNSCEQIIRNLRELKQKRKQKQANLFKVESDVKPVKQQFPLEAYHPRNSYFSSSVKKSRDPFRQQSTPKNKVSYLRPLKTIQAQSKLNNQQNPERNKKNVRGTSNSKRFKKIELKDKIMETDEQKDKQLESQQPQGIKDKYGKQKSSRKNLSPKSKSKSKEKSKKSKEKNQKNLKDSKASLQNQNSYFKEEINRLSGENKEVYDCLMEIMKYFRFKNEREEKERKKAALISQEIQVDLKDQNQHSNEKSQRQLENRKSEMKLKALIKLRQLNQRGRQFVAKMKGEKEQDQQKNISKSAQKKSHSRNSQGQGRQKLDKFTNTTDQEEPLLKKSILSSIQTKIKSQEKENEDLLKAIAKQLNRQEMQNQSLTNCLKQLSLYLKDQNEQLQALKNSRADMYQQNQRLSPTNKEKSRSKSKNSKTVYRSQQFHKPKAYFSMPKQQTQVKQPVQHTKEEQSVLKQAFLKRLKKVRLRGKLLNEKVEAYKKQHNPSSAEKQADKLQINPQLSPEQPNEKQQPKEQNI